MYHNSDKTITIMFYKAYNITNLKKLYRRHTILNS